MKCDEITKGCFLIIILKFVSNTFFFSIDWH